jgi:osmotically-inducible protein OsmY
MKKYAFIIASLLALTGCEHYRGNSGYSQRSTDSNYGSVGSSSDVTSSSTAQTESTKPNDYSSQSINSSPTASQPSSAGTAGLSSSSNQGTSEQSQGQLNSTEPQSSSVSANNNPAGSSAITPGTLTPSVTGQSSQDLGAGGVGQSANAATETAGQTGISPNQSGLAQGELDQNAPAAGTAGQTTTGTGSAASDRSALQGQDSLSNPTLDRANQFAAPMNAADQAITQSVTNALMAAGIPARELSNIHVRANNGKVILSGQVPDMSARDRIEKQVKQTPGVQTVINQLRVRAGAGQSSLGTTPPAGSLNQDTTTTPGAGQTATPGGP